MALQHVLSFQLYSSRNFPPLSEQMKTLAGLGYTNVEPFDGLYADLPALKAALAESGLKTVSGHFGIARLESDPAGAMDIARDLGMSIVVCPYLMPDQRPTDRAEWVTLGRRLGAIAKMLKAQGFTFAWHNHDFEFVALPDGSFPIEHLLADPDVGLELDAAWVARAGEDPETWLDRLASRIVTVHVKDIAPAGEKADEDGWADVGTGTVAWDRLWPKAVAAGSRLMIAEHDNPSDFVRFARASAETMTRLSS